MKWQKHPHAISIESFNQAMYEAIEKKDEKLKMDFLDAEAALVVELMMSKCVDLVELLNQGKSYAGTLGEINNILSCMTYIHDQMKELDDQIDEEE